ncbi:DEAD/DEAH box helicase [Streptacidiphilus sp. EB103A]|uniref:preprotein translocase subunit SecA n=1 Tax=Streptacidiphilus sp. EB103A TaxID=3156275 RepID=UPI003512F1E8
MGRVWPGRFGPGDRMSARCRRIVAAANALESSVRSRSDAELVVLVEELRQQHASGPSDALLTQAAAVVRESVRRVMRLRLDDVQLIGGIALHHGSMVEMKTGEGKTLAIVLPAFLGALGGSGVHVMTANDYLVERDTTALRPVYENLGMTCGMVREAAGPPQEKRLRARAAYAADVTYGTVQAFVYDYLRDNIAWTEDETVQRGRYLAIVDEADFVMVDEARQRPNLSKTVKHTGPDYRTMTAVVARLRAGMHYTVDPHRQQVALTDTGLERVEDQLGVTDLYNSAGPDLLRALDGVLKAREVYRRDRDYLVEDGEIRIVDLTTGRLSTATSLGSEVMQALAVKEGLEIPEQSQILASVSVDMFLRGYQRLAAITGVATEPRAYSRIYGLETVRVPTARPVLRVDHPVSYFADGDLRLAAALRTTAKRRATGQPVLLGTTSIAQAEQVSAALAEQGIPHEMLTAKNHAAEAEIIARAGRVGAVTVVTRMGGRGVDIRLGGEHAADRDAVVRSGGLYVLALDLFESRRLELHMRGRAGRRGDPGASEVFVALDDTSLAPLISARILGMLHRSLMLSGGTEPIAGAATTRALERGLDRRTEQQVENLCRKVRYDEVAGEQCDLIYRRRRELLENQGVRAWVAAAVDSSVGHLVETAVPGREGAERLHQALAELYPVGLPVASLTQAPAGRAAVPPREALAAAVRADVHAAYQRRETSLSTAVMEDLERRVCLSVLDRSWRQHLEALDDLMNNSALQSLTGGDPFDHYRREADRLFAQMSDRVEHDVVGYLFHLDVQP